MTIRLKQILNPFKARSTRSATRSVGSASFQQLAPFFVLGFTLIWAMMGFYLHHKLLYITQNNTPNFQNLPMPLYEYNTAAVKREFKNQPKRMHFAAEFSDVLTFDEHVSENVRETYKGARSFTEWALSDDPKVRRRQELNHKKDTRDAAQFKTVPLQATVDRRPIIVRKQLIEDGKRFRALTDGGKLLGCAITGSTFVSDLRLLEVRGYTSKDYEPTCAVCFQFTNHQDMPNFLPDVENIEQPTATKKCFTGEATATAKFASWQQHDNRFEGFGYQWQVDCLLPDGIKELTCREISRMQNGINLRDDLQNILFETKFDLNGRFRKPGSDDDDADVIRPIRITTEWPWTAVMSHDDDRSAIANGLSMSWNDVNSKFVPSNRHEMTLAHVEGPGFDKTEFGGHLSLKSMYVDRVSKGGLHPQLVSNLFHLIRNAPGSTHMIAVVDGQSQRSYKEILRLLNMSISGLFRAHGNNVFGDVSSLHHQDLIPIHKLNPLNETTQSLTLLDLLRLRGIKIHMLPIITPPLVFEKTVCGGQYTFSPYLAARYAADYHAMMYVDGDTALVEGSDKRTLNEIIYDRFFGRKSTKCAGHRLRLIEQYIKPEHYITDTMLQCTQNLVLDKDKWQFAMHNCSLKEGHIVARTDSIYSFSVHHPDTLPEYAPKGVKDCIPKGENSSMNLSPPYALGEDEFVQLHIRNRERKAECACFYEAQNNNMITAIAVYPGVFCKFNSLFIYKIYKTTF